MKDLSPSVSLMGALDIVRKLVLILYENLRGMRTHSPPPPPPPPPTHDPSPKDAYGPWTLVSKRKAKPRNISPRPINKAHSPAHRQNTLSPNDHSTHQPFNACHSPRGSKEGKRKSSTTPLSDPATSDPANLKGTWLWLCWKSGHLLCNPYLIHVTLTHTRLPLEKHYNPSLTLPHHLQTSTNPQKSLNMSLSKNPISLKGKEKPSTSQEP